MDDRNISYLEGFCEKLLSALQECASAKRGFLSFYDIWKNDREDTIELLTKIADKLDKNHKNINVAKVTGNSVSIVSGIIGITGAILLPFTMGLSAPLIAGSVIGGVAGGVTAGGAEFVEIKLMKSLMDDAKACLERDARNMNPIHRWLKSSSNFQDLLKLFGGLPAFQSILFVFQQATSRGFSKTELLSSTEAEIIYARLKNDNLDSLLPMIPIELINYVLKRVKESPVFLDSVMQILEFARENPLLVENVSFTTKTKEHWVTAFGTFAEAGGRIILGAKALASAATAPMSRIAFGALGAAFIAIDAISLVTTSKDLHKGSLTTQAIKLREAVQNLNNELERLHILFLKLNC